MMEERVNGPARESVLSLLKLFSKYESYGATGTIEGMCDIIRNEGLEVLQKLCGQLPQEILRESMLDVIANDYCHSK